MTSPTASDGHLLKFRTSDGFGSNFSGAACYLPLQLVAQGSPSFTRLSGTTGPTNLLDMTSLFAFGRLQHAIKYCTHQRYHFGGEFGQAGGRKRFWSQLNNSKTVRERETLCVNLPRIPNRGVANRRPQIERVIYVVELPDHQCGDDLVLQRNRNVYFEETQLSRRYISMPTST